MVADYFSVTAPNGGVPVQPFIVSAGRARFNGNVDIYGDLFVDGTITTRKMGDNSVTRIDSVSMAGWRYGNNVKQNAITYTIDLPYAAKLICLATGTQSYTNNERAWHFDISVNGVAVTGVGGSGARTDSVSTSGYSNLGAGQHTVTINWLGGDSTLRLVACNLIVLAVYK